MARCNKCHLALTASTVKVPSKGSDDPFILFIGEAPGPSEDRKGECFVGKAGKHLFELLEAAKVDLDWCRFANIVRCLPPRPEGGFRTPTDSEIESCRFYTEVEIYNKNPVFVVTLGNTALHALVPKAPKIGSARKNRYYLTLPSLRYIYNKAVRWAVSQGFDPYNPNAVHLAVPQAPSDKNMERYIREAGGLGFERPEQKTFTVYPTYHPSASVRGNEFIHNAIIEDFSYLRTQISGDRSVPFEDYELLLSVDEIREKLEKVKELYLDGRIDCVALDVETNCLSPYLNKNPKLLLLSIAYGKGKAFTIPFEHNESPFVGDRLALAAIVSLLDDFVSTVPLVGHNLKFDLHWLIKIGVTAETIKVGGDTYLASWTIWNDTIYDHGLEPLATRHVGMVNHKEEMDSALQDLIGVVMDEQGELRDPTMDDIDILTVHQYCCADSDATKRLHHKFEELMELEGLLAPHNRIAVPAILPTTMMEVDGIRVDTPLLKDAREEFAEKLDDVYVALIEMGYGQQIIEAVNQKRTAKALEKGKKPPKPYVKFQRVKERQALQLTNASKAALVFDILDFKPIRYGKLGPSCDKETLSMLLEKCTDFLGTEHDKDKYWSHRHEVISMLRDFSANQKMFTSYIVPLPKFVDSNNLVHTSFGIRTTRTGRYNCREPSLHIFPWKSLAKKAMRPHDDHGFVISADYSQNELRVLASVSGDEMMIQIFNEGGDIHRTVASIVLSKPPEEVLTAERRRLKTVVFGVAYGRGAKTIASQERISVDEAQHLINRFFEMFEGVKKWIKKQHSLVKKHNKIWSPFGFTRLMDEGLDDAEKNRRGVNTPIQGAGSDIGVIGLQNVQKRLKRLRKISNMRSSLFGFVHDSLLFSVYPMELWDCAYLARKCMQDLPQDQVEWLRVPLKVDFEIGPNWGELTEAEVLPDRRIKFESCKPKLHTKIEDLFSMWRVPPTLVDKEHIRELEDGSEIFQTMSATATREAKVVEKINSIWEFPPLSEVL